MSETPFPDPVRYLTPWGPFWDFPGTAISKVLEQGQFWDAHLQPIMDEAAGDGQGWALDVGAYNGFHTAYLARLYTLVIAVEPHEPARSLWRRNVYEEQQLQGQALIEAAAYSHHADLSWAPFATLGWDPDLAVNLPARPLIPGRGGVFGVPLDAIVITSAPVRFIKLDCQGCDLRALIGLEQTIARCRPVIVMEWEARFASWHEDTWEDVEAWGRRMHYQIEHITPEYQDYKLTPSTY